MEILRWRFLWFFSSYCMKEIIKLMSLQQIAGRLRRHEPKKITGLELDRMKKFKMIRDELKFDYTINFVYISSIETFFFNRKNQDQKRLESAYWERKEDNGHDKRDMRFFFVWFKKRRKESQKLTLAPKIRRHSSSFWNRKSCHARDAMRDARRCAWCLLTLTQN